MHTISSYFGKKHCKHITAYQMWRSLIQTFLLHLLHPPVVSVHQWPASEMHRWKARSPLSFYVLSRHQMPIVSCWADLQVLQSIKGHKDFWVSEKLTGQTKDSIKSYLEEVHFIIPLTSKACCIHCRTTPSFTATCWWWSAEVTTRLSPGCIFFFPLSVFEANLSQ